MVRLAALTAANALPLAGTRLPAGAATTAEPVDGGGVTTAGAAATAEWAGGGVGFSAAFLAKTGAAAPNEALATAAHMRVIRNVRFIDVASLTLLR